MIFSLGLQFFKLLLFENLRKKRQRFYFMINTHNGVLHLIFVPLFVGCRKGIVFVEQWPHREPDQTKLQGYSPDHLPCPWAKCAVPLEPSGAKPDPQCAQALLWPGPESLRRVHEEVQWSRVQGGGDPVKTGGPVETPWGTC